MEVQPTAIPDVKVITPKKFGDRRGFFSEVYSRRMLAGLGVKLEFVQDNHAYSAEAGVLRGLHYQIDPKAQAKLVRVIRGAIRDVAVDIRRDSPTCGRHVMVELSAENWRQLLVPRGFAHGYLTLMPDTEVIYKVTADYAPELERGIIWNDPDLAIPWGVSPGGIILSERDSSLPRFKDVTALF